MSAYARLSHQHQRFVDEYIIDFNATQAYLRAGYDCTEETARRNASRLLTNADMQAAIAERNEAARSRLELSKERILLEVTRLALVDVRKLYHADGRLKRPHELDEDTAAAVASFETVHASGDDMPLDIKKLKLTDKKGSLELLMRHLGLLNDKLNLGVQPENPLAALLQRLTPKAFEPAQDVDD